MYILEQFNNGYAKVSHTDFDYHSNFKAKDQAAATLLVADLNRPHVKQLLAAYRFQVETAGLKTDGGTVATDRQSQAQLASAYNSLKNGVLTQTRWKAEDGWIDMTVDTVEPIVKMVATHVDQCFQTEEQVETQINAIDNNDDMIAFNVQQAFDAIYAPTNLTTSEDL